MKRLLSVYCCILCFHSVKMIPSELPDSSSRISGEKLFVKALSALVNREENKKVRPQRANQSSFESFWF